MKPLFISRDGVINQRLAGGVHHRSKLAFIEGSLDALAQLSRQGFTLIMVTHQPGLSQGLFDLDELEAIHATISDRVETRGGEIAGVFYCPHEKTEGCRCCPPETGLLDVIEMELDCHAEGAYYLCDNDDEAQMAEKKGCVVLRCDADSTLANFLKIIT